MEQQAMTASSSEKAKQEGDKGQKQLGGDNNEGKNDKMESKNGLRKVKMAGVKETKYLDLIQYTSSSRKI
jgi:hypothetical protein